MTRRSGVEIESWWGSDDTYNMRDYQADFWVGGHYSITGAGVDGSRFRGQGEFIAIDAPNKTSYTRAYDWDFPVLGRRPTTITYLLEPIPAGTRVTVRHEGFDGAPDAAIIYADGWRQVLNWLQARAERGGATAPMDGARGRRDGQNGRRHAIVVEALKRTALRFEVHRARSGDHTPAKKYVRDWMGRTSLGRSGEYAL